jgi:L-lactate dehydrogenase complex protein LldG
VTAVTAREEILGDIRRALGREAKSAASPAEPVASASRQLDQLVFEIKKDCEQRRPELLKQFESELTRVGARLHKASTAESAFHYIEQIVSDRAAKTIIGFDTALIDGLDLPKRLEEAGIQFVTETTDSGFILTAAVADIGVSGVDYVLADTGTLVLLAREGQARSISLLPPVHIAVMKPENLISGLSDLVPLLRDETGDGARNLSSAITFITGPSRTADIELTLVIGVHGPQQLHVVLLSGDIPA